jgi:hypothetical protein
MGTRTPSLRSLLLASCAALLVSACATTPDDEMVPRPTAVTTLVSRAAAPLPRLPHGPSTYVPGHPASVHDGVIHAGGHTVAVAPLRADEAVATRGGTYFLNAGELWYVGGHAARSTGLVDLAHLAVSSDGRYLALVDRTHGPSVPGGVPVASVVAYDTTSGRVVLRSSAGMGSAGDDLRAAYAADPPRVVSVSDDAVVARTPAGRYRYPLDGSTPAPLA